MAVPCVADRGRCRGDSVSTETADTPGAQWPQVSRLCLDLTRFRGLEETVDRVSPSVCE